MVCGSAHMTAICGKANIQRQRLTGMFTHFRESCPESSDPEGCIGSGLQAAISEEAICTRSCCRHMQHQTSRFLMHEQKTCSNVTLSFQSASTLGQTSANNGSHLGFVPRCTWPKAFCDAANTCDQNCNATKMVSDDTLHGIHLRFQACCMTSGCELHQPCPNCDNSCAHHTFGAIGVYTCKVWIVAARHATSANLSCSCLYM